jgi:dUTP pyrophosphatase
MDCKCNSKPIVKVIPSEPWQMPAYQKAGDSGFDLISAEIKGLNPGEFILINTGIRIELPEGYEAQVRPRSGIGSKGIVAMFGTIDNGYTGLIKVVMFNFSRKRYTINQGDRIAQLVISKVSQAQLVQVSVISDTERGENGFGSTGI